MFLVFDTEIKDIVVNGPGTHIISVSSGFFMGLNGNIIKFGCVFNVIKLLSSQVEIYIF